MDFMSLLVKCGLVLLLSWIGRIVHTIWWRPMKVGRYLKKQGINGLSYKLLVGNVREEFSLTYRAWSTPMNLSHNIVPRTVPFHHEMVKKYGKMSMSWYGTYPRVIITEPELIREVLSTKHDYFEKLKLHPHSKFITGLPLLDGEKWAKHRKIVSPAFHREKLKLMLPACHTSCSELMKRWKESVSSIGSCELDVWHEFQYFTGDVISRTAFSSTYKEGMRIFQLQRELLRLLHQSTGNSYIPGFRFLSTKTNVRKHEMNKEVCSLLRGMILEREKEMKMGNERNDLLGLLMESNVKDSQEEGRSNALAMTIEDVIDECKIFYFAGHDTTAILLTWTLVVLSMHPHWQVLAREEVMQVFGKNDPDYDGLNHLKIVTMILYEVLRLYPPVVFSYRTTCKTVKLGDITFLPDVQVCMPIILVHHDPEIWGEDVDEFKPERFAEGISKATKNQVGFLPFGCGPRICIGQNFAMVEAKMALAMILQHFSFELSPSYAHAPHFMITLQPQYGAQVILRKL